MEMYNPPHPGEFLYFTYIKPYGLSYRFVAEKLDVAPSTLNSILKKQGKALSKDLTGYRRKKRRNILYLY